MGDILTQVSIFAVLLAFLVVGFFYKKKPKSLREYALGSGKFSTSTLTATMIATAIGGGSLIGLSSQLYQEGAWFLLALCTMPVGYCLMAFFIVPRLSKYYGCLSVAEVIGCMYGKRARKLVGVAAFVFCVGALAAQIKALHWVMEHVFIHNALIATMVALIVVVLYSTLGGVTSVIMTDVAQVIIFFMVVPAIAYYTIDFSGGISAIVRSLPENKSVLLPEKGLWGLISLATFWLLQDCQPMIIHRLLVGRNLKRNQTTIYALGLVNLLNLVFVGCVAFIAISKFPNIRPKETVFAVVQGLFNSQWVMTGFSIALMAMIASTADSLINTGSIVLINDVVFEKTSAKQKLRLSQAATIFSGIAAAGIAFLFSSVLDIVLFFSEYYTVVVLVPLFVGVFLTDLRKEAFWTSACLGVTIFSMSHILYPHLDHEIFLISFVLSLIAYFITYLISRTNKFSKHKSSFYKICNEVVAKSPINYLCLVLGTLFFYFTSFVFVCEYGASSVIEIGVVTMVGFGAVVLFFVDRMPDKYHGVVPLAVVWYCFAFFPMYSFLYYSVGMFFVLSLLGSIMLLMAMFNWGVFLSVLLSGGVIAPLAFFMSSQVVWGTVERLLYLCLAIVFALALGFCLKKKEGKMVAREKSDRAIVFQGHLKGLMAEENFQNVLLEKDTTTRVSFDELQTNLLHYFQKLERERGLRLIINSSYKGDVNTGLPLSVFYMSVCSLIFNIAYCAVDEKVIVKFCCNSKGSIKAIDVMHSKYKIRERIKYLKNFQKIYPEHILGWDALENLFGRLHITLEEKQTRLKISYPNNLATINDNVIHLKDIRHSPLATS